MNETLNIYISQVKSRQSRVNNQKKTRYNVHLFAINQEFKIDI